VGPWAYLLPVYFTYNDAKNLQSFWNDQPPEVRSENAANAARKGAELTTLEQRVERGKKGGKERFKQLKQKPDAFLEHQKAAGKGRAEWVEGKRLWSNPFTGERVWSETRPSEDWQNAEEKRKLKRKKPEEEKVGLGWWVNVKGETLRQDAYPGEGWRRGKKWELKLPKVWVYEGGETVKSTVWPGLGWRRL